MHGNDLCDCSEPAKGSEELVCVCIEENDCTCSDECDCNQCKEK